jgi:hypothetical protein
MCLMRDFTVPGAIPARYGAVRADLVQLHGGAGRADAISRACGRMISSMMTRWSCIRKMCAANASRTSPAPNQSLPKRDGDRHRTTPIELAKNVLGVALLTIVAVTVRYTGATGAEFQPRRSISMTKLILAAAAALSIFASPVLAGPWDPLPSSYDFQLQGR